MSKGNRKFFIYFFNDWGLFSYLIVQVIGIYLTFWIEIAKVIFQTASICLEFAYL